MKITKSVIVNAHAEHVWDILGPNYASAGDWASSVFISKPRAGKSNVEGAPCAGRICETSLGGFTETIVGYDPIRMHVAYSATGAKMPSFMRSLVNSWIVEPRRDGQSEVTMELNADIAQPFSFLMGWMMKMQFNAALRDTIEDLKVYAETGRKSKKKVEADASKKAALARAAVA